MSTPEGEDRAAGLLGTLRDGWHGLAGGDAASCPGCPVCALTAHAGRLDPGTTEHLQAAAQHLVLAGRELLAVLGSRVAAVPRDPAAPGPAPRATPRDAPPATMADAPPAVDPDAPPAAAPGSSTGAEHRPPDPWGADVPAWTKIPVDPGTTSPSTSTTRTTDEEHP